MTHFGADPAARKALNECEIVYFQPSRHASLDGLDCRNQTAPDVEVKAGPFNPVKGKSEASLDAIELSKHN